MTKRMEGLKELSLQELIREGDTLQSQLFEIYKNSIENIHQLKQSSRTNMELIADVEGDLESNDLFQKNIESLTQYISDFNDLIAEQMDGFEDTVEAMINCYTLLADKYNKEDIPSAQLIKIKKQMSFISTLVNKYRYKVDNLKLMSNSMLYHSEEFEVEHKLYRSNLISLAVILTESYEKFGGLKEKLNLLFKQ